ncbi:hypothetical protein GMORB2_1372 [Geosmithia morbida]|uniref:Uncharacterized protein n=1 Tax=Geosmithia morbida TaxID=1094350 RepID=A0A9P4YZW7_9HYPO|nr:uncharacterized protein GMORB2_1372 [Geosmithia morbida]KAF4126126.1 hypothetical protein GMORB2_1372 [Geosmithia morbida]
MSAALTPVCLGVTIRSLGIARPPSPDPNKAG